VTLREGFLVKERLSLTLRVEARKGCRGRLGGEGFPSLF